MVPVSTVSAPPRSVTVRVPAKVNCELRVGPLGADGYHELSTVFMAVGLYDEVTVTRAERWSVTTTGPYAAHVPSGSDNLAMRAARLLARHMPVSYTHLDVYKRQAPQRDCSVPIGSATR